MAYQHPNITQALGELMSLRPTVSLDATDEMRKIDRLDDKLYKIVLEGIEIMSRPRNFDTGRQQAYFQRLAAVIAEWDRLRR